MSERRISGTVTEACQFKPDAASVWLATLAELRGKRVTITVESEKKRRSNRHNAYWWAVCVPFFQELWSQKRRYPHGLPPYTKKQVHEILVEAILGCTEGPIPGTRERVQTHDSDTKVFSRLVDGAREMAMHDYHSELPEPGQEVTA